MATPAAHILVVDDNEMNRDMLSRRLERRGFRVGTAADGQQALQIIAADHFDLVLLDVMMPGIDGLEVLRRVRSLYSPAILPVIIATSKDKTSDVVRAFQLGASDYVVKPLDFAVLVARIETHLALKQSSGVSRPAPPVVSVQPPGNASASRRPSMELRAGSTIGRFSVIERIGQGGMGQVFLARDPALKRPIAIKVLRGDFTGPQQRERFAREAQAAAQLGHPNIVTIFDVGDDGGLPFIAMEFVPGESLAQKIRSGTPLPTAQKLHIAEQLCSGVACAHAAGLIHRDIKPANVMITPAGDVKVLDFGIARGTDSDLTHSGVLIGSLNYMAPEQLRGGKLDHRVDIFAIGAVLYELFSYRQAFPGGIDDGILSRILQEGPPVPLNFLCPTLDSRLVTLVESALKRSPDERPQSAELMRRQLLGLLRVLRDDDMETTPP